ncbi:MAG: CRISPR system precrRNA processing endoribonuclease RAMP protein Cas6 [Candidatus Eremiobacteraeota bacterium]|nr:CRISPR system precrRNA processing endoribonuclease RAMP protein Cas6 [Candidatus Eremiobacteraeota bacterium]
MLFTYGHYQFDLNLEKPVESRFLEATIRGGFGFNFKNTVCINQDSECNKCDYKHTCVYQYVFETMPPPDTKKMRKYNHVPHPFVLYLLKNEERRISFGLKLFGGASKYLPYFIHSFIRLGKSGLGRDRSRFDLERVVDLPANLSLFEDGNMTSNKPETCAFEICAEKKPASGAGRLSGIKFSLKSPLAIRKNGLPLQGIVPESFIITLLRRLGNISYFHLGQEVEIDFRGLKEKAKPLSVRNPNLTPVYRERFSTRQGRKIGMEGIIGDFILEGDLTPFHDFLKIGEIIHIGRGTSFGQGRYEMKAVGDE